MGRPKTNDAGYADFTNPQPSRNTLVIITSDNGGASKDEGNFSNALLRGSKGSVFEGGIRVPLYAYWIGKTLRGIQNNSLLRSSDLISTLVELAGGKYETITEGESFAPILKTRKSRLITRNKPMFWHQREQIKFCGNIDEFIRNGEWKKDPYRQAVRDGNWKFVSDYETDRQREYLFNFANSESEENFANVISSFRQKANEMRSLINNMAVNKSHYIQSVDRVEGTALGSGENLLTFNSPGGRVILKPHDLNESHDGSYTYAI